LSKSAERIAGRIVFADDARPFRAASIEVILEDTTYADAPAVRLARTVLRDVAYDGARQGGIAFELERPPAPPASQQCLRVWVDIDDDGRLGKGDYRNAERVAVPHGTTTGLVVRMKRID
jgi:hypothetical protein